MIRNTTFLPADPALFFSKKDAQDPRLGDYVEVDASQKDFAIWGYPDERGVELNGGRLGAKDAPQEIRRVFYKLTPSLKNSERVFIVDMGDLNIEGRDLLSCQEEARKHAKAQTKSGRRWISLGGGHDYGYSDACGFLDACFEDRENERPLILNFDAHLDVRPFRDGRGHSGTPFFRVLNEYQGHFDFFEVGIQDHCNSRAHLKWVQERGGQVLSLDAIEAGGPNWIQKKVMELRPSTAGTQKKRRTFVSVDMDVFSSSDAPGCSQSWGIGLNVLEFRRTFQWLLRNFDVRGLGVYEVSPALDFDQRTSKLAALILHQFLFDLGNTDGARVKTGIKDGL